MDAVLDRWAATLPGPATWTVLPDGCRDVIFQHTAGTRPVWFVSSLYDRATTSRDDRAVRFVGYRLLPGTAVEEARLLRALAGRAPEDAEVDAILAELAYRPAAVSDALDLLAEGTMSVARVAQTLGVSPRTLQRHLKAETGRSPAYWRGLARARRAARALDTETGLGDLAAAVGYADQAHMTHAFRRWFKTTPTAFRSAPHLRTLVAASGYDAPVTGEQISTKKPSGSRT